jgi:ribosome biogenesis protein BMS1
MKPSHKNKQRPPGIAPKEKALRRKKDSDDEEDFADEDGAFEDPELGFGAEEMNEDSGDDNDNYNHADEQEDEEEPQDKKLVTPSKPEKKDTDEIEFDPFNNPPKLVLVQGPPKSGKTTLIRSLIKHYTSQNVPDPKGPITIKTSKKQRITLLECPNEISAMTEMAKVPDIVLCLVDASLGFEMQTFEFLSMLQIHGFPKCIGVATHFDYYKNNKRTRKVKQMLKKRLEAEVSKETKLFFISDIKNSLYSFRDVHNLARFISIINPRELEFKKQHPHIVVDRHELLTTNAGTLSDNSRVDVAVFGYIRGNQLMSERDVYLSGLGFLRPHEIKEISDPVPLDPELNPKNQKAKRKRVPRNDQERFVKGGKDKLASLKTSKAANSSNGHEEDSGENDDDKYSDEDNNNDYDDEGEAEDQGKSKNPAKKPLVRRSLKKYEKLIYAPQSNIGLMMFDESGDYVTIPDKYVVFTKTENQLEGVDGHEGVRMVRELHQNNFQIDQKLQKSVTYLIDGIELETEDAPVDDPLSRVNKEIALVSKLAERVAGNRALNDESKMAVAKKFKTTNLHDIIYKNFDFEVFEDKLPASKSEANGNNFFEEENAAEPIRTEQRAVFDCNKFYTNTFQSFNFYKEHLRSKFVTGFDGSADEDEEEDDYEKVYQNDDAKEMEIEHGEAISGHVISKGRYVKMVIRGVKFSLYQNFSQIPLIISQFPFGENTRGFLLIRLKKHRFYKALMKTNDPLIFSIGFQKFQSLPYFCRKDLEDRMRMVKYTPKFDYCLCAAYSNYVPNNTGIIAFQSLEEGQGKFRVSAVGVVIGFSTEYKIQKKLKLIGEPFKIYKNTAFIKNMFNSELEVAKFMGAKIKTVSGIRGQIKKTSREGPEGSFRAVFEDKILMSDIVFMRTWYTLLLEKYYNPVVSFNTFELMKTTWQLRKKYGIKNPEQNKMYPVINRPNKKFAPLVIPKKIKEALPFKTKDKITTVVQQNDLKKQENKLVKAISSDKEKEARYFIQRLKLISKEKDKLKKQTQDTKRAWKEKWTEGMERKGRMVQKTREQEKYKSFDRKKRGGKHN